MSGSTIGGVVGGVIGFVVSGYNPAGFQWGWAIGSAIGGYVDPVKVQGPRLADATTQTAQDGVPIPFGYGTFPTAGNIIWTDKLREHKTKKREGKGGPVVTTYTYTRSFAIGICEGPIDGILLIKRNGKIIFDARDMGDITTFYTPPKGGTWLGTVIAGAYARMTGVRVKFYDRAKLYLGDESQMPDPTIEAIEGVGNVSPYRGMAYMVVKDENLTDTQGAIPQYEFVVAASGELQASGGEVGQLTDDIDFDSLPKFVYVRAVTGGVEYLTVPTDQIESNDRIEPGNYYRVGRATSQFVFGTSTTYVAPAEGGVGSLGLVPIAGTASGWMLSEDGANGYCELWHGGTFAADLRPDVGSPASWFYAQNQYSPEWGGLIWFGANSVYMLVRKTNNVLHNRIYKWPLINAGGAVVAASATSATITSETGSAWQRSRIHVDRLETVWALSEDDATLKKFDSGLALLELTNLTVPVAGTLAFAVDSGLLILLRLTAGEVTLEAYDLETQALVATRAITSTSSVRNCAISVNEDSLIVQMGTSAYRVEYTPDCLGGMPPGYEAIPDAPGYAVSPSGKVFKVDCSLATSVIKPNTVVLGEIVADLCARVGVTDIDVSDLTDSVPGYKVASQGGADSMLGPLMQAYYFDAGEWDGKLRFVKRGSGPSFVVGPEDFAQRDGEPVSLERVQEAELLRKVTFGYIDPATTYTVNTQAWERRATTVAAKGEAAVEIPVVCTGNAAAQMAEKRGRIAWSETEKVLFSLPALKWARLTPTDVGTLYLPSGDSMEVRIGGRDEESGALLVEATRQRSSTYTSTAQAPPLPLPPFIDPPLIGPTTLAVMDLPALREADDRLGVYIAAAGVLSGWRGASVQVSSDGGATNITALQVTEPATMGTVVSGIGAWVDSEYPAVQTINVTLPDAPSTLTRAGMLRYGNVAAVQTAVGWEVLQFETVTTESDGSYTLGGLLRGRYATMPAAIAAGARFVILDEAVQFVPVESWMLNRTVQVRAVSAGTSPDAVAWTPVTITGASQREWAPTFVRASRDGSDTVTVKWIGRARIGAETAPRMSTYATGYRVTFSDGFTADVNLGASGTANGYTRASTPAGVTVSVAALNSITGPGPASESASI